MDIIKVKKNWAHLIAFLSLVFSPVLLFAQSAPTAQRLLQSALSILNLLISLAIGLSLVVFLFALIKYVTAGGSEDKSKARGLMIYGIITLFVCVSVWGLVRFIQGAVGITGQESVSAPNLPTY